MSTSVSAPATFNKQVMIADKLISLGVLFSLSYSGLRADVTMAMVYLLLYPYLYLTSRRQSIKHLIVASVVACCWYSIGKDMYGYNRDMLLIAGYTVYPLFAWAVGLFGVHLIYAYMIRLLPVRSRAVRFPLFVLFYWALLFGSEILAYHYFHFRNIATAQYAGLPVLDCIHVPDWMKIAYLLNGPIYFLICELSRFPDPSNRMQPALSR